MYDSKYSKLITVLLIIAIVIILLVLGFLGFRLISNNAIISDADEAVERFQGDKKNNQNNKNNENSTNTEAIAPVISLDNTLVNNNKSTSNGTRQMYKGFPMVGTIEIPSTNVKYPILEKATTESIKVAVAIYDDNSAGLNQVGNTTIVGHNYRNGTFFSDNKKIAIGDKVYITDESGTKITYIVYNTLTTAPEDSSYMERDTEGKREISLLTCTDDTQSRLIVFAREE